MREIQFEKPARQGACTPRFVHRSSRSPELHLIRVNSCPFAVENLVSYYLRQKIQQLRQGIADRSNIDLYYQAMNEMDNLSSEFSDEFLRPQTDADHYFLNQESFEYRPTQEEMKALALEGVSLLFIDCLKGK
jgi:hypothetical protein